MGITRVRAGDTVLGAGRAPDTGENLNGKKGKVQSVENQFGEDVVTVKWNDGGTNCVRQSNVSGTRQG